MLIAEGSMKHQWQIRRQTSLRHDGARRLDQAYQHLLRWAQAPQEDTHESGHLCTGINAPASPSLDDRAAVQSLTGTCSGAGLASWWGSHLPRWWLQWRDPLRQLEATTEQHLELARVARSIEAVCEQLHSGLEQATFEQRALVELLIDCVVVTDAEVEIRYVMPLSRAGPHRRFCHWRL